MTGKLGELGALRADVDALRAEVSVMTGKLEKLENSREKDTLSINGKLDKIMKHLVTMDYGDDDLFGDIGDDAFANFRISDTSDGLDRDNWMRYDDVDVPFSQVRERIFRKCMEQGESVLGVRPYEWQARAASFVQDGNDACVVTRTGDGKSMVSSLNRKGISAVGLTKHAVQSDPDLWKKIDRDEFRFVFATPKILLSAGSYFWTIMAPNKNHRWLSKVKLIVFDEAHCIWKYGKSGFRIEYRNLGNIRTYLRHIPILLLSATLTPVVTTYIHKTVEMAQS
ncbi:P-loop containing nucleoside triphosphate hydrolase protein [Wilcoxina mikolae CBS 423.85]|nr:P-loop containing nucleoside triphosphate hydrolase protein [Wilcoxina mikolae CBS 423.85]